MEELIERFEKETGLEFYTVNLDRGEDLYNYDFVNWLIKQLIINNVVSSNFICNSENRGEEKCKEQCAWCDGFN